MADPRIKGRETIHMLRNKQTNSDFKDWAREDVCVAAGGFLSARLSRLSGHELFKGLQTAAGVPGS